MTSQSLFTSYTCKKRLASSPTEDIFIHFGFNYMVTISQKVRTKIKTFGACQLYIVKCNGIVLILQICSRKEEKTTNYVQNTKSGLTLHVKVRLP